MNELKEFLRTSGNKVNFMDSFFIKKTAFFMNNSDL